MPLQNNDDDHGYCRDQAVPLETGGKEGHMKIFTTAYINQVWGFTVPNGFFYRWYGNLGTPNVVIKF
jgi:hypothetical protein